MATVCLLYCMATVCLLYCMADPDHELGIDHTVHPSEVQAGSSKVHNISPSGPQAMNTLDHSKLNIQMTASTKMTTDSSLYSIHTVAIQYSRHTVVIQYSRHTVDIQCSSHTVAIQYSRHTVAIHYSSHTAQYNGLGVGHIVISGSLDIDPQP